MNFYLCPTLYATYGAGCEHMRFVRLPVKPGRLPKWQLVKRLFGPVYIGVLPPFHDDEGMFTVAQTGARQ